MTGDMYQRPSREEIAARVNGQMPGANSEPKPAPKPRPKPDRAADPVKNFGIHLTARLRAMGLTPAQLAERAHMAPLVVTKAANGNGIGLDGAARLAAAVGRQLPDMLGDYQCGTCQGTPPAGFTCQECGTEGARL